MPRLKNTVALITGAARGIGAAIAEAYVADGAHVIVTDIDEATGRDTAARLSAGWMRLDVREELAWIGAMARVLDSHGRLDVLVNNAGITGLEPGAGGVPQDPENASLDSWRAVMRTNLDGVFLGCRHALRAMRRHCGPSAPAPRGRGAIINLSSRSAVVGVPGAAAYAASKAAIAHHTRSVALYCAEQRLAVRCNALMPGAILTPMWEPMLGDGPERETRMAALVADTPLQRFGTAAEVASLAVFLASDESAYITGASFAVDGGLTAGTVAVPAQAAGAPEDSR
jgi:NAD(P)-dependent dehydrogenase (short-subunit alcohol dehydrogenase family)